jgi:hypothetical protein
MRAFSHLALLALVTFTVYVSENLLVDGDRLIEYYYVGVMKVDCQLQLERRISIFRQGY